MSTFFEKLTGARTKASGPETIDLAQNKKNMHHTAVDTAEEKHPVPLAVKHDEHSVSEHHEEALVAEEGELTVDIYNKGDAIVIQSTVAGVKPEDLDVAITNDSVTIRGKREQHHEVKEADYYYKELFWGTFSRSVILPEEIEEDAAEATLKHGLLTIALPKKRRGVVQKLKVKLN